MSEFLVPPIVLESYDRLYDLCQNHNRNGVLPTQSVAGLLGKDYEWLNRAIYAGAVPFAFGTNKVVGRGASCIHVLPFYQYMTQGALFRPVKDRGDMEQIIKAP